MERFVETPDDLRSHGLPFFRLGQGAAEALEDELARHNLQDKYRLVMSGCPGFCEVDPIIVVYPDEKYFTAALNQKIWPELVQKHFIEGEIVERLLYKGPDVDAPARFYDTIPFYRKQKLNVLRNCGIIDPENIDEYIMRGGYRAFARALKMEPQDIYGEVKKSGLRGRGGAGFPTGLKWEFTARTPGEKKYVVCNADEGDPGAFMDRSILEGDPHAVLEGMLICGQAIGADEAIYCRAEYPLAIKRLKIAIAQAEEYAFSGKIFSAPAITTRLTLRKGAGAFVCGEETALLASIEGKRGMPRPRPPFPAQSGLLASHLYQQRRDLRQYPPHPEGGRGGKHILPSAPKAAKYPRFSPWRGKIRNTGLCECPWASLSARLSTMWAAGLRAARNSRLSRPADHSGSCITGSPRLPIGSIR